MVDGNGGLKNALNQWDGDRVQPTMHDPHGEKSQSALPAGARPEMKRGYDKMINAKDSLAVRAAYEAFRKQ